MSGIRRRGGVPRRRAAIGEGVAVNNLKQVVLIFAVLQGLWCAAPRLVSAPTTGATPEACLLCGADCDAKTCHAVAMDLAGSHDFDRAIAIEERVYARQPQNPEVAAALARMYQTGRHDVVRALRFYHEALFAAPGYPPALLGLGEVMQDRGQTAIAERYFSRGAKENPDQPVFKVRLAQVLIETGRSDTAQAMLQEIVSRWPDSGEAGDARKMMSHTALARP